MDVGESSGLRRPVEKKFPTNFVVTGAGLFSCAVPARGKTPAAPEAGPTSRLYQDQEGFNELCPPWAGTWFLPTDKDGIFRPKTGTPGQKYILNVLSGLGRISTGGGLDKGFWGALDLVQKLRAAVQVKGKGVEW